MKLRDALDFMLFCHGHTPRFLLFSLKYLSGGSLTPDRGPGHASKPIFFLSVSGGAMSWAQRKPLGFCPEALFVGFGFTLYG